MPAKIDAATVKHIAKLASLSLSDDDVARFTAELARIVAYVEELETLDTSAVEPTASPARAGREQGSWRADVPAPSLSHEDALAASPRVEHDGFAVPAFVKEG